MKSPTSIQTAANRQNVFTHPSVHRNREVDKTREEGQCFKITLHCPKVTLLSNSTSIAGRGWVLPLTKVASGNA